MKAIALLLSLSFIPSVLALGVASDYLENNTLKVPFGVYDAAYQLRLQNAGDNDVKVMISVGSDMAVASAEDEGIITIPAGTTKGIPVDISITIPSDAKIGDAYEVAYTVKEVAENRGQVAVAGSMQGKFRVEVADMAPPEEESFITNLMTGMFSFLASNSGKALVIIAGICLIAFLAGRRKSPFERLKNKIVGIMKKK